MMDKTQLLHRLIAMVLILFMCVLMAGAQLANLQLVNGEEYVKRAANYLTTTSTISAARGEIMDRYGRPLVTNKTVFSMVLIGSTWQEEGQFERLLDLAGKIKADQGELQDDLPITQNTPYTYIGIPGDNSLISLSDYIKKSAETLKLPKVEQALEEATARGQSTDEIDATQLVTAAEFVSAMRSYLETQKDMPMGLSDTDARTLVGLYYSIKQVGFSTRINFTLATDVSIDLIAVIKEHHKDYVGVDFETEAIRQYETKYAAHLLGYVGTMWTEEWTDTKNGGPYRDKEGYSMNDDIGKSGIEAALEPYLHGKAGSRPVETTLGGDTFNNMMTGSEPEPGDNVILTIDIDLQQVAEDSLKENLADTGYGSAAVALEVNTGEILASASYPTFDLENYNKEYAEVSKDERTPHLNRVTGGQYAPGSTFKVLTAIAGLEEGIITPSTYIECTGEFYYGGQRYLCRNHNTPVGLNVVEAIKYSCNTFFYTVGRDLTGAHLEKWCEKFGLGQITGIEIGENSGHAAGPTFRNALIKSGQALRDWQGGDDVNAAIGQSDNAFTPLQLASYVATVANHGTRYRPTLVRSIKSYDYSETVRAEKAEVAQTVEFSDTTFETVMQGMSEVTAEGGTAATVFANYPIKVGGKTGTAETSKNVDDGVFIAFAPFDDPQIAVCVVGEGAQHGSAAAPVVRDIMDAYFNNGEEAAKAVKTVQMENILIP